MKRCSIPTSYVQAYKIVRRNEAGVLTSIISPAFRAAHTMYAVHQWVLAPKALREHGYGLCIFRTMRDAYAFLDLTACPKSWQLWRCEAQHVRNQLPPKLYLVQDLGGNIDFSKVDPTEWPAGTLMADAVRLVEYIPWEEISS